MTMKFEGPFGAVDNGLGCCRGSSWVLASLPSQTETPLSEEEPSNSAKRMDFELDMVVSGSARICALAETYWRELIATVREANDSVMS